MNEGVIFYWIMWMGWVYSTFLMKKNPSRARYAFLFLFGIILSGHSLAFSLGSINTAVILFGCTGFYYAVNNHQYLYRYLIGSFAVAISYVSIELFSLYDPVKSFVNKKYILLFIVLLVLLLVSKNLKEIFPVYFIGIFIGDTLYQFLIYRLQGFIEIGSKEVLDLAATSTAILLLIFSFIDILKKMKRITYKKVPSTKQI